MLRFTSCAGVAGALIVALVRAPAACAQSPTVSDSLVSRALASNPAVRAAAADWASAQLRVRPAGAWPDPMLMAGIQNLPLSRQAGGHAATGGGDPMTMKMIGVSQTVPYPGKTSLRTRAARADAEVAEARLATARREVKREVLDAYYDVVAARMLLGIIQRQQQVATSILPATEARYVAGAVAQSDVLKARTEAAMLVEERNAAAQDESAALALLNAALDQPSTTSVVTDSFPARMTDAKPLPSLDSLQALAIAMNPRLRERKATLAAQTAQALLAKRDYLPDFDLSVQYGQRDRLPDMITATVSIPVPLQRGRKQSGLARAAQFDVATAEAQLRAEENAVRAEVARSYTAIERDRANLALLERAILPQARATFASASASYQSGRMQLLNVLDSMRALFATETMYVRTLADFAKSLAELEALVGDEGEVVR